MTVKRYFKRTWEGSYYIFDSNTISEDGFEERVEYEGYDVFADSLTGSEIIDLLNENEESKQEYLKLKHRHSLLHDECLDAECERDSLKKDVNSLEKENEKLKEYIKNNYMGSVCDNCEYCKEIHTNDWFNGIVHDAECEKGHINMDISDCKDFKLTSKVFIND